MGEKKDIGKLFENKLKKGKKTPENRLWEKINTSLNKEKRRRKRIFYYWISGGLILSLSGAFLFFGNSDFLKINSTATKNINEKLENNASSEKIDDAKSFKIVPIDSLSTQVQDEKLRKITSAKENQPAHFPQKLEEKKSKKNSEKKASKNTSLDESFKVSEKYYYYNSRDGKQIVTQDKSEIDSLILKNNRELDSSNINKNDTLRQ
ncbi:MULTISPECIES: hypothetical protein [Aequorivita]|uniref:Uncharacterized protein n=1 Tax=Aequorivita iocasae TaxID=2803865 RepID=A0ABX7DT75_9FLAO|nr:MULTISPECIES: hypothetical protein [Aequorivita]QQX77007.1 hypothetical protein JK629_01660 [Aequorivita iocasae]UCA56487.1 hypothetical protein LDL78_01675 [Aequorivita sp. F7]